MITKTELEEILDRVEASDTTGEDADKLRAWFRRQEGIIDRLWDTLAVAVFGEIPPPETR